jgi:hypothetical protein
MSAIIAAVRDAGFPGIGFSVGRRGIELPEGSTYTATYTEKPGKDLQELAQACPEKRSVKAYFLWNDKTL